MSVLIGVGLVILGALLASAAVYVLGRPEASERESPEAEALRACLRISLAAWQARQEMARTAQLSPPARQAEP